MNNHLSEAFFSLCANATPARRSYVSLYVSTPFYGGPEEGGWWGEDVELVAYQLVSSDEDADALVEKIKALAEQLNKDAKRAFSEGCRKQLEWLEQRGLDSDFLPEVDGEESYYVTVEETPGSHTTQGSRQWG
jgi:hypothetical protein